MIKYTLNCRNGHEFESWFRNAAGFDEQSARGCLVCPVCASVDVNKAIMAPALGTNPGDARDIKIQPNAAREVALVDDKEKQLQAEIRAFRHYVFGMTEDVGARFPQEVRKIADGDGAERPLRGQATAEEAKALLDEGICILPLPLLPEDFN